MNTSYYFVLIYTSQSELETRIDIWIGYVVLRR